MKKDILNFMSFGSPMNQLFVIDALLKAGVDFGDRKWDPRTNIEVVKGYLKHWGDSVEKTHQAITSLSQELLKDEGRVRALMANSFVSADAWLGCAEEWINIYYFKY